MNPRINRKLALLLALFISASLLGSCSTLGALRGTYLGNKTTALSVTDIANGLKEALKVGTKNSVSVLHKSDGFLADATVKILFPASAQKIAKKLRQIGMGNLVDDFVKRMNRGAEQAVKRAVPIFVKAITDMSFADAKKILAGPDNAATIYFRQKTSDALYAAFAPEINKALGAVGAAQLWTKLTKIYNRIPFVSRVETDIVRYATNRALAGLFKKVEIQEKRIRKNPAARVTKLLARVFSTLDK